MMMTEFRVKRFHKNEGLQLACLHINRNEVLLEMALLVFCLKKKGNSVIFWMLMILASLICFRIFFFCHSVKRETSREWDYFTKSGPGLRISFFLLGHPTWKSFSPPWLPFRREMGFCGLSIWKCLSSCFVTRRLLSETVNCELMLLSQKLSSYTSFSMRE